MAIAKIVLLSGPICSGKSSLSKRLIDRFGFSLMKTTEYVMQRKIEGGDSRRELQEYGKYLDTIDSGQWILNDFSSFCDQNPSEYIVIDSVRTELQINKFREKFGRKVVHVHLTAPDKVLRERYASKMATSADSCSYDDAICNESEREVGSLSNHSDIAIDTIRCLHEDVFERTACLLGLYGMYHEKLVDVIVGGQYGSEGKGNVASYLSPEYQLLVRVGGSNAGHKVKLPGGGEYVFSQLPSGSGSCDAKLVIGAGAVINPDVILREIEYHKIDADRLCIDPQAMIVSQNDIDREIQLKKDISSTGSGTGIAASRRIADRGNQKQQVLLAKDHANLQKYTKRTALEVFEDAFRTRLKVLLEGTQGTGLSLYHGYYPYVTSRDTTVSGCLSEAGI